MLEIDVRARVRAGFSPPGMATPGLDGLELDNPAISQPSPDFLALQNGNARLYRLVRESTAGNGSIDDMGRRTTTIY